MDEWSESKADRATAVWDRLLGCFGEGLLRKYGATPPQEWRGAIASLGEYQLQRGMRRLLYSGKGSPPTLPEFLKLCRTVGHDDNIPDEQSVTTFAQLSGPTLDAWDLAANQHFLKHVITRTVERRAPYTVADLEPLLAAKRLWVRDMRDLATNGEVPVDTQKEIWREYIGGAEGRAACP